MKTFILSIEVPDECPDPVHYGGIVAPDVAALLVCQPNAIRRLITPEPAPEPAPVLVFPVKTEPAIAGEPDPDDIGAALSASLKANADRRARWAAESEATNAAEPEAKTDTEIAREPWEAQIAPIDGNPPAEAKAAIFAELQEDACDIQSDYFNVKTVRRVLIGWSGHTRDLFSEMRKAAATFPPTAHLGPGCDVWSVSIVFANDIMSNGSAYWKGSRSHWHGEVLGVNASGRESREFLTEWEARRWIAEQPADEPHAIGFDGNEGRFEWAVSKTSIEHREKYSMGHGYYLKAGSTYGSGWTVSKSTIYPGSKWTDTLVFTPAPSKTEPAIARADDGPVTVSENVAKGGIEIRFADKPSADVLARLKASGWRWSRFSSCWYQKATPDARAFAAALKGGQ